MKAPPGGSHSFRLGLQAAAPPGGMPKLPLGLASCSLAWGTLAPVVDEALLELVVRLVAMPLEPLMVAAAWPAMTTAAATLAENLSTSATASAIDVDQKGSHV